MNYNQQVMTLAHQLYRASDGRGRDLFAACLSVAHSMIKQRSRTAVTLSLSLARQKRARNRIGRFALAA